MKKSLKIVSVNPQTFEAIIEIDGKQLRLGASYHDGDWDEASNLSGLGAGQILKKIDAEIDKLNNVKPQAE